MDSSSSSPHVYRILASAGTCSPARTHTKSPSTISAGATSISLPPRRTSTGEATRIDRRSSVIFARNSVTMPIPVLMMMTSPNTASFHDPVSSTTTIAVRIIALNRVNTFARMIEPTERDVLLSVRLVWPCSTRVCTASSSRPCSSTCGMPVPAIFPWVTAIPASFVSAESASDACPALRYHRVHPTIAARHAAYHQFSFRDGAAWQTAK